MQYNMHAKKKKRKKKENKTKRFYNRKPDLLREFHSLQNRVNYVNAFHFPVRT
jgi:hypothetical protein